MDVPFGKISKITSINSKALIADDQWKMGFLSNAPVGWKEGDRIRLSETPKLGSKRGSSDTSTARVQVENLDKKSAGITVYFEGSILKEKSFNPSPEPQASLKKNIRLDREAAIRKILPGNVIEVEDAEYRRTKWQLDITTARGRVEWSEGDTIVISKGATPTRNNIKNIDRGGQTLGALFISDE